MSKELAGIIGLFFSLVATASVIGVVQAGDSELRADMRIMKSQITTKNLLDTYEIRSRTNLVRNLYRRWQSVERNIFRFSRNY